MSSANSRSSSGGEARLTSCTMSGSMEVPPLVLSGTSRASRSCSSALSHAASPGPYAYIATEFPHRSPLLPRVRLVEEDRQRLQGLARLIHLEAGDSLLQSCNVFSSEMLNDFPAQVFLQEPAILKSLVNVVERGLNHPRYETAVISALGSVRKLVEKLSTQIYKYRDPSMFVCSEEFTCDGSGWSLQELCWCGLSMSGRCLRVSDTVPMLGEALSVLRASLALHATCFPDASMPERSRVSLLLAEVANSRPPTFAYLQVLHIIKSYLKQWSTVLKESDMLKVAVQSAAVSAGVWCINQSLSREFIVLLNDIPYEERFRKLIGGISKMCQSITTAQKLVSSGKIASVSRVEEALPSLDLLPSEGVVCAAVEALCRADSRGSDGALALLAHGRSEVQVAAYQECRRVVRASVGAQQARDSATYTPGNIAFLCTDRVLQEILCFGLQHDDPKIKVCAEDILLHISKCEPFVSGILWTKISSCLYFLMPLIVSLLTSSNKFAQSIIHHMNPDNKTFHLSQCIRGNACLLFSSMPAVRAEAALMLLKIIEREPGSLDKLPQNTASQLDREQMSSLCIVKDKPNLDEQNHSANYNEMSLRQVLSVLEVRQDAILRECNLRMLATMLLESRLIPAFIEAEGWKPCITLLDAALKMSDISVSSRSVKPIIAILSTAVTSSSSLSLCRILAQNESLLVNIIRAMFLYSSIDSDFQQHLTRLLAMLLLCDFLRVRPGSGDSPKERLVLSHQLLQGFEVPFRTEWYGRASCQTPLDHWRHLKTLGDGQDENLSLLLRCHLTLHQLGTLRDLAQVEALGYLSLEETRRLLQFDAVSMLSQAMRDVTSDESTIKSLAAVQKLSGYLPCVSAVEHASLPWREHLMKILTTSPATTQEEDLLRAVLKVLVENKAVEWIPTQDLLAKLDIKQQSTVQNFLPLLESSAQNLQLCAGKVLCALRHCLSCFKDLADKDGLRSTLRCLSEVLRAHNVQISSRLMAEFVAPLIDVVDRFSLEDESLVRSELQESALQCLSLLQTHNLEKFAHHFFAFSEQCDINNILLQIALNGRTIPKSLTLSILAGLARFDEEGNPNVKLDLILRLVLEGKEACCVRHQAVIFLSALVENSGPTTNLANMVCALSASRWFEHLKRLSKRLYLPQVFTPRVGTTSPKSLVSMRSISPRQEIVTPEYLAAHFSLIYNLCCDVPVDMLAIIREHGLFGQALSLICSCLEDTSGLSPETCKLITSLANLVSFCLITSGKEHFANEIREYPYLAPQLLKVLQSPDHRELHCAVLWLMVSLQQSGQEEVFLSAHQQGRLWQPLAEALERPSSEQPALLLTRSLTIRAHAPNPHNHVKDSCGSERVCELLLQRLGREDTHEAAMAALAGVLASCPHAREFALRRGLLDSVTLAMRNCRTALLTVRDIKLLAHTDKQMHPLVKELSLSLELLAGFLMYDPDAKSSASTTILNEELHQLWHICMANPRLREATLKFLVVYTAGCEEACSSLLLRQQLVSGVMLRRCASSSSLFHQLVQQAVAELLSPRGAHLALRALQQCCMSTECRTALVKTSLLNEVFSKDGGFNRLPKPTQNDGLLLTETLTRYPEGQQTLARDGDAVETLTVLATEKSKDSELTLLSVEILRNICFCPANRVLVLASGPVLSCFLRLLRRSAETALMRAVGVAVWSLAANQHRSKQALRVAGVLEALAAARQRCEPLCPDTTALLDSTLAVLAAD